jgi:glycosyltransferase involved in cell wall biosynthesis
MKILIGCLNVNGLGGSEMYHYELSRELKLLGNEVVLFSMRDIDYFDQVRIKLRELGIIQVDTRTLNPEEQFDIMVLSQPEVNVYMLNTLKDTPCISIIHSEIRSEDPILSPRISHYITIRDSIRKLLIEEFKIDQSRVSLIYNPIDKSRFNPIGAKKHDKTTGIFVGGALDSIRFKAVCHLAEHCIENDWDLKIMSDGVYDFDHPNISYINSRWDTEHLVKNCDFTAGILMGRTTLEGWCCGVPGYMYQINKSGDILSIETEAPKDILTLCDSRYVAQQHVDLYKRVIEQHENNL